MIQLYITKYIPMLSMRVFNNLYILEIAEKYLLETLFKDSLKVIITLRKSNRRFQIMTMKHTTEEIIFFQGYVRLVCKWVVFSTVLSAV